MCTTSKHNKGKEDSLEVKRMQTSFWYWSLIFRYFTPTHPTQQFENWLECDGTTSQRMNSKASGDFCMANTNSHTVNNRRAATKHCLTFGVLQYQGNHDCFILLANSINQSEHTHSIFIAFCLLFLCEAGKVS